MKKWKNLLNTLRKGCAYDGDETLADVLKFVDELDTELTTKSGQTITAKWIESAYMESLATKSRRIKMEDDEDEDDEDKKKAEGEDEDEDDEEEKKSLRRRINSLEKSLDKLTTENKSIGMMTPVQQKHHMARKAYNQRVQQNGVGIAKHQARFADYDTGEAFGAWMKRWGVPNRSFATPYDNDVLKSFGYHEKASSSAQNSTGGALIPEEFRAQLIVLEEQYGVARQLFETIPMNRETLITPEKTGNVTVYQPGQNNAITDSDLTFRNVELLAREWAALSRHPMSLLEDSAIDVGSAVAESMAREFARQEDLAGFIGDGTSTYFGVTGCRDRLREVDSTITNIGGLVVGSDDTWGGLTLVDFEQVVGTLPEYADQGAVWVCSKLFWSTVMLRLALASGGVTRGEVTSGAPKEFLGYPVVIAQGMPRRTSGETATSKIDCLFGNFAMGAYFGDRKAIEITTSDQRYFENNQIAIRAIQRLAITVFGVGTTRSTPQDADDAGPITGLITASS